MLTRNSNPSHSANNTTHFGWCFLLAWVFAERNLKGGTWQQSGGLFPPPWLFRRKVDLLSVNKKYF